MALEVDEYNNVLAEVVKDEGNEIKDRVALEASKGKLIWLKPV